MTSNIDILIRSCPYDADKNYYASIVESGLKGLSYHIDRMCCATNSDKLEDIIERSENKDAELLSKLLEANTDVICGYYYNDGSRRAKGRQALIDIINELEAESLPTQCFKEGPDRHLSLRTVPAVRELISIAERQKMGQKFDVIAYVASGGAEPALLIADVLQIAGIVPIRYSRLRLGDKIAKFPSCFTGDYLLNVFKDKKAIVVEDSTIAGKSVLTVSDSIQRYCPKETYLAIVIPKDRFDNSPVFGRYGDPDFTQKFRCL